MYCKTRTKGIAQKVSTDLSYSLFQALVNLLLFKANEYSCILSDVFFIHPVGNTAAHRDYSSTELRLHRDLRVDKSIKKNNHNISQIFVVVLWNSGGHRTCGECYSVWRSNHTGQVEKTPLHPAEN